jgi:broad specificity phosphatase PhoE
MSIRPVGVHSTSINLESPKVLETQDVTSLTKAIPFPQEATQNLTARVVLIRHCEATRDSGQLTTEGLEKASKIGLTLGGKISVLYASPHARTKQTAEAMATTLRTSSINLDDRLKGRCDDPKEGGDGDLRRYESVKKFDRVREEIFRKTFTDGPLPRFFKWQHEPSKKTETIYSVYQRGVAAIRELALKHPGKIVGVVTHGVFIDTLMRGISSEEEVLARYYEPKLPGDKRQDFPEHGAAYNLEVSSNGTITLEC